MKRLMLVLFIAVELGSFSLAQSQSSTADFVGVVKDQTGAVLPGATVTVTNAKTGLTRSVATGSDGRYRIPAVPPGVYNVKTVLAGFATKIVEGVVVTVGQYADLTIELAVSAQKTEVVVSGSAQIVEREKTVQASTIQEQEIDNLPINGRNFLDFTLLTPGVTDKHNFVTFSAVQAPTSGLSFSGQDQRSNYVTIDGADNMDILSNSVRSTLSQDAIQEFQISRNTFSSEFGRARGGVINIVSKSGTNAFHGDAFFFLRNDSLDARNAFAFGPQGEPISPQFKRYQWGGTLGGPIVPDRTFFFSSYERLDRDESVFVTFLEDPAIFKPTPSQSELFGFLSSTGLPSLQALAAGFIGPKFGVLNTLPTNFPGTLSLLQSESGTFPFSADSDIVSLKIDHEFSENNQFFARFNFTDSFNNGVEFGALQGVSNGVSFDARDFAFVGADTQIFSPVTLNDFKFQYARREFKVPTNDPVGPEIVIAGVAELGREFFNPSGYDQNIFQWGDNLTLIRGTHSLKMGVDLDLIDISGFASVFLGGQFSFAEAIPLGAILDEAVGPGTTQELATALATPVEAGGFGRPDLIRNLQDPISSLQAFNFGLPITYFQGFGNPNTSFTFSELGVYLQDNWKLRPNFTLNLGLRYETDWRPETSNVQTGGAPFQFQTQSVTDRNNFAPRVGFAWDPGNNGKTVIRGGYGIYYENFFEAVAFVSQVLSGQIKQVFLPLTGLPGFDRTSADVWAAFKSAGKIDQSVLGQLGISPGTTPSVILPGAANVVNPYSHQASFGIEKALTDDLALSVDYLMNRGVHLIRSRDVNVRQTGPNQFGLPGLDPRFVQVNMIETSGSSIYHGLTVSLRKRFRHFYSARVSYTLGKAIDDTTDFITQLQANNQRDLRAERSLSSFDQRHRLVLSAVLESPSGASWGSGFGRVLFADWTLAPIITWSSGKPFNLLLGFDANGDTHEETDRPVLQDGMPVGRNTGRGPSFFTTDLRLSRKFPLPREATSIEFMFEAFNLFNHVNFSGVNNVIGSTVLPVSSPEGSSGIAPNRPLGFTSAFDPRQIQLGFRVNF